MPLLVKKEKSVASTDSGTIPAAGFYQTYKQKYPKMFEALGKSR